MSFYLRRAMKFLRTSWLPITLGLAIFLVVVTEVTSKTPAVFVLPQKTFDSRTEEWLPPDINALPDDEHSDLIRYGKDLIDHTSVYFGPNGTIASLTNGMNCVNCHPKSGTVNYGNPFSAIAATYPKYKHRSGRIESIEFRVNDCMQRSLNGTPLDSNSKEMKAMVAYLTWMGKDVPKDFKPKGAGTQQLPYLSRAADPSKGKVVFEMHCVRCHGLNGEGVANADGNGYQYPPLWGEHSYNVSAGMFTISKLSGFIKNNMPYGTTYENPVLTNEQAWDVAAYILSKPRPMKLFAYDWKDISKKPVDYPFGPYADNLSEQQHKYGPFVMIKAK